MAIERLNEELHKHDGEMRATHPESPYDPEAALKNPSNDLERETAWNGTRRNFFKTYAREIRIGSIAFSAIVFVTLLVGAFVRIQQSLFANDRVVVSVTGPDSINSSSLSHFTINYENRNRSSIHGAELVISYPSSFRPEGNGGVFVDDAASSSVQIGDIAAFSKGKFEFSGKFYGSKGSTAYIRAKLRYMPSGVTSEFVAEGEKTIALRTSSLAIEVDAPLEVPSQGEVTYLAHYENTSDSAFSNVRMKANYPVGFSFTESDPRPAEGDSVWYLGTVPAGGQGEVRITGSLQGGTDESKTISFEMGTFQGDDTFLSYSNAERTTRIVASPFDIVQSVNDRTVLAVSPGENLRYNVQFRNASVIGLREAIVTVELRGAALDLSKLLLDKGGAYNDARKTITWKASDVKALANLAPGEEGVISFAIPVRDDIVPANTSDKNYRITTVAKIESPDVPNPAGANKIVATNTLSLPVNSRLSLETVGLYHDATLSNTGPVPPVVGSETTYTIRWKLSNTTNDVSGAEVSADLPTGARWIGKFSPDSESISYNERTNRIVWNIGSVSIGVGALSPKREVAFQIGVTPQANQVNFSVPLLSTSVVTAKDLFTNDTLRSETDSKTTQLPEDLEIPSDGYRAVTASSAGE